MKIDRRCFLAFGIGGGVGTAFTPLPWKLTDDLAIWSQNWPWTPVPKCGQRSVEISVCTLCPAGCGISVKKVDDRIIKIEGLAEHPVNKGGICQLGLSAGQLLYGPSRVAAPLKRVGARGRNKWRRITWKQAISEVGIKLGELRAAGNPQSLACISATDKGTVSALLKRFMSAYGSSNFIVPSSAEDSYTLAAKLMQGGGEIAFDLENSDFILSFGSGLIEGWGSPVRMFKANSKWRTNGAKVVQVEPRLSVTAAKADHWIAINPGSEVALAMGLCYVLLKEARFDVDFVNQHTFGFEDWVDGQGNFRKGFKRIVLETYPLQSVEKICGIKANDIVDLARAFSRADKPLAVGGRGQGTTPLALNEIMAIQALNALQGNLNQPGGVWLLAPHEYINWPEVQNDEVAAAGLAHDRIDGALTKAFPFTGHRLNHLVQAQKKDGKYPLQALLVARANPLYAMADTAAVQAAFAKIALIVNFGCYMDETAQYADYILPDHHELERYQDVPSPPGLQHRVIGLARPVIEAQLDTQNIGDTIIQLARKIGGGTARAFPWGNYITCLKETLGANWKTLMASGFIQQNGTGAAPLSASRPATPSGKFEFCASVLSPLSEKDLDAAFYTDSIAIEGDPAQYPFILIPFDSMRLANDTVASSPFMIKTVADTVLKGKASVVEINPQSAHKLGLDDGKMAILTTPKGRATVKLHFYEGVKPGVIALPRGLGHTAYDEFIADKGVNFNQLIGPVNDLVSGMDAAWGIRAKLGKV